MFVGYDKENTPRYASLRGISGDFKGEVAGSNKRFSFSIPGKGQVLHVFESAIDLLSFATLEGIRNQEVYIGSLLSLSGIYVPRNSLTDTRLPPALSQYLSDNSSIRTICLHLDNDSAGRQASKAIISTLLKYFEVRDEPPKSGKDYNLYLCGWLNSREVRLISVYRECR